MQKLSRKYAKDRWAEYATNDQVLVVGDDKRFKSRYFPDVLTVDINPDFHPDIVADVCDLPFDEASFGTVHASSLLAYVADVDKGISEMYRVLKPGGVLLLGLPFTYPTHSMPIDKWRFTRQGIELMLSKYKFSSVDIAAEYDEIFTIAVFIERIILQAEVRGGAFTKGLLLVISRLLAHLGWIVTRRYGNIERTIEVPELYTTNFFVAARKGENR